MKDHYAILEVEPSATAEQLKSQHRLLLHAWHPDKFPAGRLKARAEEKLKAINEAFHILGDPVRRARYDALRYANSPARPKPAEAPKSQKPAETPKPQNPPRPSQGWIAGLILGTFVLSYVLFTLFHLEGPSPSQSVQSTPTIERLLDDNNFVRLWFAERPNVVCSDESNAWTCKQNITPSGTWEMKYQILPASGSEFYVSEYSEPTAIDSNAAFDVLANTTTIISDSDMSMAIFNWALAMQLNQPAHAQSGSATKEFGRISVLFVWSSTHSKMTICVGSDCPTVP
jgi:curved DNA-binding protein CbpA